MDLLREGERQAKEIEEETEESISEQFIQGLKTLGESCRWPGVFFI